MQVTAKAVRSGNWWAIEVPEVPGLFTQARRLDQVQEQVIDAAAMLDVDVDSVAVVPVLPPAEQRLLEAAKEARASLAKAEVEASTATRAAIAQLRNDGLTVREVAEIIGVSHQRISALTQAAG